MPILAEQPPLILVATLNAPTRVALARLVARRGMTALACFDGAAVLAYAHAQRSEVWGAIVDPQLPSINGQSLARALREEGDVADTLVLCRADDTHNLVDPTWAGPELSPDELARVDAWLQQIVSAWG
jgi:DNA-binding response OmpR family regulator